jgi:hypothetical protein
MLEDSVCSNENLGGDNAGSASQARNVRIEVAKRAGSRESKRSLERQETIGTKSAKLSRKDWFCQMQDSSPLQ